MGLGESRESGSPVEGPEGFEVGPLIGTGATARVYLAHRSSDRTPAALKILRDETPPSGREAFLHEAALFRRLSLPGIPRLLGAGEWNEHPWVALELADGPTLAARLAAGPIPWPEAFAIFRELAGILASLHGAGWVHRDVKPANIAWTSAGRLLLLDLGVAARFDGTAGRHDSAPSIPSRAGTPRYMAPEQIDGRPSSPATDLYALGLCLFESIAGVHPFAAAETEAALFSAHLDQPAPRLSTRASAPPAADAILGLALAKRPNGRYESGAEFAEDLRRLLEAPELPPAATIAGARLGHRLEEGALHGRAREVAAIRRWLDSRSASRILFLRGSGGAGRTALLRIAGEEAALREIPLATVDDVTAVDQIPSSGRVAAVVGSDFPTDENGPAVEIEIRPLPAGSVRRWATAVVGSGRLPKAELDRLLSETGGLPSRLAPALRRWSDRIASGQPPRSIDELFSLDADEARRTRDSLESVDSSARLLFELAARLHPCAASLSGLAAATGLDPSEVIHWGSWGIRSNLGLRIEGDRLFFADPLRAGFVRALTADDLRRDLLETALDLLSSDETPRGLETRAQLARDGGRADDAQQLAWQGALASRDAGETDRFLSLVALALELDRPLADGDVPVANAAAGQLEQQGRRAEAEALLARAERLAPLHRRPEIEYQRAMGLLGRGEFQASLGFFRQVARAARHSSDLTLRVRALHNQALALAQLGRERRALRIHRAIEGSLVGLPAPLAVSALSNRAILATHMGELDEARRSIDLAIGREVPAESAAGLLLIQAEISLDSADCRLERSIDRLSRAIRLARQASNAAAEASFLNWKATLHLQLHDPASAAKALRASNRRAFSAGIPDLVGENYDLLAEIALHAGEMAEVRRMRRLANRHAGTASRNDLFEADLALLEGRPDRALTHLEVWKVANPVPRSEDRIWAETLLAIARSAHSSAGSSFPIPERELAGSSQAFRIGEFRRRAAAGENRSP